MPAPNFPRPCPTEASSAGSIMKRTTPVHYRVHTTPTRPRLGPTGEEGRARGGGNTLATAGGPRGNTGGGGKRVSRHKIRVRGAVGTGQTTKQQLTLLC